MSWSVAAANGGQSRQISQCWCTNWKTKLIALLNRRFNSARILSLVTPCSTSTRLAVYQQHLKNSLFIYCEANPIMFRFTSLLMHTNITALKRLKDKDVVSSGVAKRGLWQKTKIVEKTFCCKIQFFITFFCKKQFSTLWLV